VTLYDLDTERHPNRLRIIILSVLTFVALC